ncbi:T9SS type A sorting domain-containing protein [candidate division WOR-3 bacterium]|nr:T9SS type A sorting domain-containing protein [candidate division WOR-3 bacterium]
MKKILIVLLIFCAAGFAQEIGARYLIITHDNFYDAIQPLAQWKHKKGMRTKVVKLSEIGSDSTQIKNYITDAYNNWQIRPEFLLLVGAPNYIPFFRFGSSNYSDNYYTDIEGNIYNEILSGRLTVHSQTEAQTVVNKILLYERTPYMDDSLWFINACLIVREDIYDPYDDSIYWSDANHAKNLMLSAGYDSIDTLSRVAGHSSTHIIQAVNAGRAFVLYRGQGVGNWWSPFDVNPDATANGAKLPIVLSITCRTIGTGPTPATAEKWLLTGTPTTPRGGAGYFATTRTTSSAAHLRSAVCKGFFSTIFEDGNTTFGGASEGGRRKVYEMYSHANEYRGFTTLGDPEMNIWTDNPCSLICTHPVTIPVGNANFTVNVVKAADSSPVNNAIVCVMGKLDTTVYVIDTTNSSGDANFSIAPLLSGDTMYVTVTGKNLQPYEGSMLTTGGSSGDHYYIWNPDPTPTPGENMHTILTNLGYSGDYGTTLAPDLTQYQTVFVCVGIYNNNYVIDASSSEAAQLVDYLQNQEGKMYLEGGDVWYADPLWHNGYDFGPLFGIDAISDGSGDLYTVAGQPETFTEGMSSSYGGENSYIDHLKSTSTGYVIFRNASNTDSCGIANDHGDYKTIGTSFELGLLIDTTPPSTCTILLDSIMHFFGITPGVTETVEHSDLNYSYFEVYPNPFSKLINIRFQMQDVRSKKQDISLKIYDVSGRIIKSFNLISGVLPLASAVIWNGTDDQGRKLPEGIYFVQFTAGGLTKTQKTILLK